MTLTRWAVARHGLVGVALILIGSALALDACSTTPMPPPPAARVPVFAAAVRVVNVATPEQCVTYARRHSAVRLRGDAWTWWRSARGRYARGHVPARGAVLVFKRHGESRGHLAVVTRVVRGRLVLASHANWLNRGRIFVDTPIEDVSRKGDWSAVRVWYPPGRTWGAHVYPTYGFIYGESRRASLP